MKTFILTCLFILTACLLHSQWIHFPMQPGQSVWASSSLSETLGGKLYHYKPDNVVDGDLSTAWVEGAADGGIGENLTILTNRAIREISIYNGFSKSKSLYEKNNRIKKMDFSILIGYTAPGMVSENDYTLYLLKEYNIASDILLDDRPELQSFEIPLSAEKHLQLCREVLKSFVSENPVFLEKMLDETGLNAENYLNDMNLILLMDIYGFTALRITIKDIYSGSHYNDSCLTEISMQLEDFD